MSSFAPRKFKDDVFQIPVVKNPADLTSRLLVC